MSVLSGALLAILEEAGTAVLTLTEGVEEAEFFASRLTREESQRQVHTLARTTLQVPPECRRLMPEIDWDGWQKVAHDLSGKSGQSGGEEARELLWFAIRSLTPATLLWLRIYRKNQPELFDFSE